jgi:cytochrome c-type biogenesis protein CcmH/NrfG
MTLLGRRDAARQMDHRDLRFDELYTMEALVHGPDPDQALAEFHRVLSLDPPKDRELDGISASQQEI